MRLSYLFFINTFLSTNSLQQPRLCVNCKHFIKNGSKDEYGKCKVNSYKIDDKFLITGIKKESEIDYYYCSTARSSFYLCGKNGRKYKENNIEGLPIKS
jgi:hypothetical protein